MISMSVIVSVFMCLSANIFLELHFQSSPNFLRMLPMLCLGPALVTLQ